MTLMKDFYSGLDADIVIEKACKIRMTTKQLQGLARDYQQGVQAAT